jgi:CRISPR-associated protein Csd2
MNNEAFTKNAVKNRYDFVWLFDVSDGNPNGDPDAGNMPRVDPETMRGFVTDVSLKRKVRDFVETMKGNEPPYRIYVQHQSSGGTFLNALHDEAHNAVGTAKDAASRKAPKGDQKESARQWMCSNFYDVRTFGAVMTTGSNAGQVRGPVQLTFARSIDPVFPTEVTITRVAKTTEARAEMEGTTEMGRKNLVPYGLYLAHGFVSPSFAAQTGFSEDDLALFWQALLRMFEDDRSATRGFMATRALIAFKHDSPLGNAPAHELFERVRVVRKPGVDVARQYLDYEVQVAMDAPAGVTILQPKPDYASV